MMPEVYMDVSSRWIQGRAVNRISYEGLQEQGKNSSAKGQ
jgi:hypothetical protein